MLHDTPVNRHRPPSTAAQKVLSDQIASRGVRALSADLGVGKTALSRAAAGMAVSARTLAAVEKIVPRTRTADEFATVITVDPPRRLQAIFSWTLESIRAARDEQSIGIFARAVRMAEAMRTDDALFNAYLTRIAPTQSLSTRLDPTGGARGARVARKAQESCIVPRSVLLGIHGTLANHGVAIGHVVRETTEDGGRVDMRLEEWPLEHVRWNPTTETLQTQTRAGLIVDAIHGDGQWVVFRKFAVDPWKQDACVRPGCLVWAAHADGLANWAGSARSHGLAKLVGEMASGVPLKNEDGTLSEAAQAFVQMMQDLASGDSVVGVRPAGAKTDVLANPSTMWQVFSELITNREKAAARIYLGTDAILGSVGGAPGVDISELFRVASTRLQGDVQAIQDALNTGLYQPWTAVNYGDSSYAPVFAYNIPDPDKAQTSEQRDTRRKALLAVIKEYRDQGMTVDQNVINRLAKEYGVDDPPVLAPIASRAVPIALAPTDVAKVVRVDEARASQGLGPLGDERGKLTIVELDAAANAPAPAAPAPPVVP